MGKRGSEEGEGQGRKERKEMMGEGRGAEVRDGEK